MHLLRPLLRTTESGAWGMERAALVQGPLPFLLRIPKSCLRAKDAGPVQKDFKKGPAVPQPPQNEREE